MSECLQLGLVGLGTVGAGVYETLSLQHDLLEARAQISFCVKRIAVRDLTRPRPVQVDAALLTDDWREIVNDPDIDIVIELIGGTTEAFELVQASLRAGKPLITGNKALLAEHGGELFALSAQLNVPLYFEASCGGGIPIIQSLQNSLICNNVRSMAGIINGTSNYILSSMKERGVSFAKALKKAQALGFAEADPTLDINGGDAAHKALILAMLAYGKPISPEQIAITGIERVEATDFDFAQKLGYTIKLLVVIKLHDTEQGERLELRVQPSFVPLTHLLANVNGVFNAIAVRGDIVGETIFYGRGAGKNPTASAVIGDIVLAMRECRHPEFHTGFSPYSENLEIMPADDTETPYYVRFKIRDEAGGIAALATIFTKYGISISATNSAAISSDEDDTCNNLVFVLHQCPWGKVRQALEEVSQLNGVVDHPSILRIEHFCD